MAIESITQILDQIPRIIEFIRSAIIKIIESLNLPINSTYAIVVAAIALMLSYYWIKQWITYSIFTRMSTLLNWILLALLIYISFVYI